MSTRLAASGALAEQQLQFQAEKQKEARANVMDRLEQYRVKYEEMQVTAVAAQMEVTSLQFQLDKVKRELGQKAASTRLLVDQLNTQKALNAEKEKKLEAFQQKLATIKTAVRKKLDERSGDKALQLMVDSLLLCCHELRTHAISVDEFHSATDLILSTLPLPHHHQHPSTPSHMAVVFGEEGRRQLESLPQDQRRARLAELVGVIGDKEGRGQDSSRSPSPMPLMATPPPQLSQFESVSSGDGRLSVVCNGTDDGVEDVKEGREREGEGEGEVEGEEEGEREREEGAQEEGGGVVLSSDSTNSGVSPPSRRHFSEPQFPASHCLSPPPLPPRSYSLSSPSGRSLHRSSPVLSRRPSWLEKRQSQQRESAGGLPLVRSMSASTLRPRSRPLGAESEDLKNETFPEDYTKPLDQLRIWRRRLGVTEGSIFTGSLPHISRALEEEEEEEEDDIGGGVYLDPREIASVIVSQKVSRKVSQRMQRRVNTLLSPRGQPVYLRLVGSGEVEKATEEETTLAASPYVPMASHLKGNKAWTRVCGGEGREGGSWFDWEAIGGSPALSNCTSDCDGSSVDWEAKDDRWGEEQNVYATIPDWWEGGQGRGGKEDPAGEARMVRQPSRVSTASGEGIYAVIDELGVPRSNSHSNGIKTSHVRPYSEQLSFSPSKTSSLDRHTLHLRGMKSLDGYEYLDSPVAPPIPPWLSRPRPSLPPRKKSAPEPRRHIHAYPTIPIHQLELSPAPYSPAISSDETQSDGEQPAGLYTTSNFITMEKRPHPPDLTLQEGNKQLLRRATHSPGLRARLEGGEGEGEGEGKGKGELEQWRGGHMVLRERRSKSITGHPKPKSRGKLVEHSGYLAKLDGRLKAGRRKWFVLKGSELKYYKNKEGSFGRPRRTINLSSWCKLATVDELSFKLTTSSHTYHLVAATRAESEGWVCALQAVLKTPSEQLATSTPSSLTPNNASSLTGWAHVTENGQNQRMWCSLAEGVLHLSPGPSAEPLHSVNMLHSTVRKVRDSLLMDNKESSSSLSLQLSVREEGQPQPLLIAPERPEEKEMWFYQLSLASNKGHEESLELTITEQLLATIAKEGGASGHPLWKHPVLNVTEGPLRTSLTSLSSATLISKAIRLFQSVQLFVSTPIIPLALDSHIAAVQHMVSTCLRHHPLQNELYCQVLRQLAGHEDPNSRSLLQGWYLLSLLLPMFLPPRPRISWYLQAVLERTAASPHPALANYAQQCQGTVEQVKEEGPRKWRPSWFELQGLLSCYAHLPSTLCAQLHLPVQLPDGATQELEFGPSTTVQEIVSRLNEELRMPDVTDSGFALMSDWPGVEECAAFFLPFQSKLCDLLSCWMAAAEELGQPSSKPHRVIQLSYRNRLSLRRREGRETDQEAVLLAYQVSREVVSGRHPVSSLDQGMRMAAIMAQIEYGDWESVEGGSGRREEVAREALLKFAPTKFTHMTLEYSQSLYQLKMTEEWCQCAGRSRSQCARDYLSLARQWRLCGATLFLAEDQCSSCDVWLAVHEEGVCLLCLKSLEHRASYSYSQLSAFGGDGSNLVLVTSSSAGGHGNTEQLEKLLLAMPKAKIHQATDLMTSYLKLASGPHH